MLLLDKSPWVVASRWSRRTAAPTSQDGLGGGGGGGLVVEHVDERSAVQMFDDELATLVIQIPHRWDGESCFSSADQEARFADHSANAKAMVKVW